MSIHKKHGAFNDLYQNRHSLYLMYINAISVFNENDHLVQLSQVIFELVGKRYNLQDISHINEAISKLEKFRQVQKNNLTKLVNAGIDYKKEYNSIVASIIGLRCIEVVRYNISESDYAEVIEYETDESNPDGRAIRSLRIAENELLKTMYELSNNRFKCEALCKISKSICKRLHRRRETLRQGT
jgi:hypothetical protein